MATIKVIVDVELDGKRLPGFPWIRRKEVNEAQQFDATRATGGGYVALPTAEMATLQVLLVRADQAVTVRLDNQSDAGIELAAGGILIVADATIDAGAALNALLSNASGSDAQVEGLAGGE